MNSCIECGSIMNTYLIYKCDKCKMNVCSLCAALTETEAMCLQFNSTRRLKFFCTYCDWVLLTNEGESRSAMMCIKGVISNIVEELSSLNHCLEKKIMTVQINLEDKIQSVKEANDLINLFSDTTKKSSLKNSKSKQLRVSFGPIQTKETSDDDHKTTINTHQFKKELGPNVIKVNNNQRNVGSNTKVCYKNKFVAAEKRVWMYISRVDRSVSEEDILDYLQNKLEDENFIVKELPTKETQNKCFMVGASLKLKSILYDDEFWPSRVGYKRFDFKKYRAYNKRSTLIFKRSY